MYFCVAQPEEHDQVRIPRHLLPHQEQKVRRDPRYLRREETTTNRKFCMKTFANQTFDHYQTKTIDS